MLLNSFQAVFKKKKKTAKVYEPYKPDHILNLKIKKKELNRVLLFLVSPYSSSMSQARLLGKPKPKERPLFKFTLARSLCHEIDNIIKC